MNWKAILAGLIACLAALLPALTPASAAQELAANTDSGTGKAMRMHGADIVLPAGWIVEPHDGFDVLHPPEPGMTIAVTRIDAATDASDAVAQAWHRADPTFRAAPGSVSSRGAVRGWDDYVLVTYDTPPSEGRMILAAAFRHGSQWTVFAANAALDVLERHQAELGRLTGSILPEGATAEDLSGRLAHPFDAARIAALRSFVEEGMRQLRIPGAALAVIEGDRIIFEQGLGVRRVGSSLPVDAHTRFMIGSNTKGMTTLLFARLVGEGKVQWDTPAAPLLPGLALADPEATARLQVRHLVCACTGLPRADLETYFVNPAADSRLALRQLAALRPTTTFGSTFQYSNTLAAVAGFVAGHLAYPALEPGKAYDRAMRTLVWDPLGMHETTLEDPRTAQGNVAAAHADTLAGGIGFVPQGLNATLLPFRPAGSAWSSVHDMALYTRNEVMEGKLPDGRQWVGREALLARRARGVSTGSQAWYGMGIETREIAGIEVVHHGGSVSGYKSDWIVLPASHLGIVLLTNGENALPLITALPRKLIELLYDAHAQADADVAAQASRIDDALTAARATISGTLPANADLGARYTNPVLGTIIVRRSGDTVRFDFGAWESAIGVKADPGAPGGFDYVSIAPSEIGTLAFVPGRDGNVRTLTLRDSQHTYVYRETGL